MKLITVEARFTSANIDEAIAAFETQTKAVRAMDGCESYSLYRSGEAIAIVQKWQNTECFDAYRKSDVFAGLGAALKPLMSVPPVTTIASVDSV